MKKIIALLLAVMLVFSLSTTAFALYTNTNGTEVNNGTITISGIASGYHYSIYKMLHLYTYENKDGAYTYKVEPKWAGFFAEGEEGLNYVDIDKNGFVTWKVANTLAPEFAQKALEYANEHGIAAEATASSSNTELVFEDLTLGYYLVDTSMGVMCGLTTTKPNASIASKNGVPTIEKEVEEDSNVDTGTSAFGETNSADIGQIVNFDITITTQAGAHNYVYHDQMDAGFEYYEDDEHYMVVKYHDPDTGVTDILTEGAEEDYVVVWNNDDCAYEETNSTWDCTFEVVFNQTFLNEKVAANDKLYITYSAKLMDDAAIGAEGNHNAAAVTYGDGHGSEPDETTTYTYGFEIFKTDAALKPLKGAEFQLYDSKGNLIQLAYHAEKDLYRRATMALEGEELCTTIIMNNTNGLERVVGLDNGDYYLRETKSPDGYTLLTEDVAFTISGHNLYATQNTDGSVGVGSSVHVENNKGITMPETGAMGTTMFITFGMFVVLGTGILLVTKKRMSMIED